jgi:hypothetical protein
MLHLEPAGRILVDRYALSALEMLLPAVVDGLLTENWRIRQSSVRLLGKLLFKVCHSKYWSKNICTELTEPSCCCCCCCCVSPDWIPK